MRRELDIAPFCVYISAPYMEIYTQKEGNNTLNSNSKNRNIYEKITVECIVAFFLCVHFHVERAKEERCEEMGYIQFPTHILLPLLLSTLLPSFYVYTYIYTQKRNSLNLSSITPINSQLLCIYWCCRLFNIILLLYQPLCKNCSSPLWFVCLSEAHSVKFWFSDEAKLKNKLQILQLPLWLNGSGKKCWPQHCCKNCIEFFWFSAFFDKNLYR